MSKEAQSKKVNELFKAVELKLKELQADKFEAQTITQEKELMCQIFYHRGIKRGILDVVENLNLDLDF